MKSWMRFGVVDVSGRASPQYRAVLPTDRINVQSSLVFMAGPTSYSAREWFGRQRDQHMRTPRMNRSLTQTWRAATQTPHSTA